MPKLTLDDLRADIEAILKEPEQAFIHRDGQICDSRTHSIGEVMQRLGAWIDEYGKPVQLIYAKVTKPAPKSHHKKGDWVIWREPS